jgi:hypothetical protein
MLTSHASVAASPGTQTEEFKLDCFQGIVDSRPADKTYDVAISIANSNPPTTLPIDDLDVWLLRKQGQVASLLRRTPARGGRQPPAITKGSGSWSMVTFEFDRVPDATAVVLGCRSEFKVIPVRR